MINILKEVDNMENYEKELILKYYGEFYNEECGKWNTSLKAKWYDYVITEYFEEHFNLKDAKCICNIGIGPGYWDRYLSYNMNNDCKLVCVDIDSDITETFSLCLKNEQNNNNIEIVNNDIFNYEPQETFDIITIIGSAVQEIGFYNEIFEKSINMLNYNGELFYSCVNEDETQVHLEQALINTEFKVVDFIHKEKYGMHFIAAKISK